MMRKGVSNDQEFILKELNNEFLCSGFDNIFDS